MVLAITGKCRDHSLVFLLADIRGGEGGEEVNLRQVSLLKRYSKRYKSLTLQTLFEQLLLSDIIWLAFGALLIGIEKAGVKGLSMPAVSIYAMVLGGKASVGLVLLLFMLADLLAVRHYFRAVRFEIVLRLLGPAVIGVVIGAMVGHYVDDRLFKDMLAVIILVCLALMFFPQFSTRSTTTAQKPLLGRAVGLLTGFSTMIANVSSPILAIYLLALKLPKREFIGAVVWFFFLINIIKLPFHVWSWHTVQLSTLKLALTAIPVIALGFLIGLAVINRIPEKGFRYLIIGVTVIASLRLLFS